MPLVEYLNHKLAEMTTTYAQNRIKSLSTYNATLKPDYRQHLLKISPVDLYALKDAQARLSVDEIKKWFFDGLVLPNDLHLLQPSTTLGEGVTRDITENISRINELLSGPPSSSLKELESLLKTLFQDSNWIGIGRALVDENKISIDILNTLLLWQAGWLESEKYIFSLQLINAQSPLMHMTNPNEDNKLRNYFPVNPEKLFDCLAVLIQPRTTKPKIDTSSIFYFQGEDEKNNLIYMIPSAVLFERYLLEQEKCYLLPLYASGYCTGEDFIAAAYLGARLMQLYIPNAEGNLFHVHGKYLGGLSTQHDWFHCVLDYPALSDQGLEIFKQRMKMLAIIANTWARMSVNTEDKHKSLEYSENAHYCVDNPVENLIRTKFSKIYNRHNKNLMTENKKFFNHLFSEMIYSETGVYLNAEIVECVDKGTQQTYSFKISIAGTIVSMKIHIHNEIKLNHFLDTMREQMQKIINVRQQHSSATQLCIIARSFKDNKCEDMSPSSHQTSHATAFKSKNG